MATKVISIVILLFAFNLKASVEYPYIINSVEFVGEDGFYVDIVKSVSSLKVEKFNVEIENQKVRIVDEWFNNLNQPNLQSLRVTKGCAPLKMNVNGTLSRPACSTMISFKFHTMTETDALPDWYEPAEVTFYFSNGVLEKRLIERKDGPSKWSSEWLLKEDILSITKELNRASN